MHEGMQTSNNSLNIQTTIIITELFSLHNFHHELDNAWQRLK